MTDGDAGAERLRHRFEQGRLIKICGLRESRHAVAAAVGGADCIGFIFAPARRLVAADVARAAIAAAREAADGRPLFAVGVFVDAPVNDVLETVSSAGLDVVQLHGTEPPEYLHELGVPAIKALRPRPGETVREIVAEIDRYFRGQTPPVAILVDGYATDTAGGSGVRADWELTSAVAVMRPLVLGGGLAPGSVGDAIRRVRPLGVDVSSGVETDGVKDPGRIAAFTRAARRAFGEELTKEQRPPGQSPD
jgi:phosphoribosylanthranilate isomerase